MNRIPAVFALPGAIVNKIRADVVAVVERPDFQERIIKDALEPIGNAPEEFAAQIRADLAKWAPAIKASGARLD